MPRAARLAAAVVALVGCATSPPPREGRGGASAVAPAGRDAGAFPESDLPDAPSEPPGPGLRARLDERTAGSALRARLAARAGSFLGRRGPFRAAGESFNGDCSGFAQAVYAAEGIDLRGLMQRAAPDERQGVRAAWLAARAHGTAFGAEGLPEPGDLVFWHDTYDRNRNGKADDRFTHVGIVERVEGGTVTFLHRGGKGVARGVMTLGRGGQASAPGIGRVNSVLRARSHPVKAGGLAGELFAGYGRIGEARVAVRGAGPRAGAAPAGAPPAAARARPPRLAAGKRPAVPARKNPGAPGKRPPGPTATTRTAER